MPVTHVEVEAPLHGEEDPAGKTKCLRFARVFGKVAVLAAVAVFVASRLFGCFSDSCDACCELRKYQEDQGLRVDLGGTDVAIGTVESVACRNLVGMEDERTLLYSASKMVTGYTILKLVDEGRLSLDTKVADILDFWNATDARRDVTVRHLLSQTSGLTTYPGGLGACTAATTYGCAKQAYEEGFADWFTVPGEVFVYTATTFHVVSAMALEVTGLPGWNDVFQQYMAQPLGIDGEQCGFIWPTLEKADAGGGLDCTTSGYIKILQAILGKTLYTNAELYNEAERPHTLDVQRAPAESAQEVRTDAGCDATMMPICTLGDEAALPESNYWHYGLGQWIECSTPRCDGGILRASSIGFAGTYPWVDRGDITGNTPHWGLVVRWGMPDGSERATGQSIVAAINNVVPKAAEIVQ